MDLKRDETRRTGAGTADNPLTDIQIQDLAEQGFQEGDFVPGAGILTPTGTFRNRPTSPTTQKVLESSQQVRDEAKTRTQEENTGAADNLVSSSDEVVTNEQTITEEVSGFDEEAIRAAAEREAKVLEDRMKRLEEQLRNDEEFINREFDKASRQLEGEQKRESAFLSTTLNRIGGYLGATASGTGALINLHQTHRQEVEDLASARVEAIIAARTAISEQQFELAKAKAEQARQLEEDIAARRESYITEVRKLNEQIAKDRKAAQDEANRVRDDARSAINNVLSNFGSLNLSLLPEEDLAALQDMAALAGFPPEFLGQVPTRDETKQAQLQAERDFDNQVSLASLAIREAQLSLSQARTSQSLVISDIEAQRRGLPQSVIGVSEAQINADMQSEEPPQWFIDAEGIDTEWNSFRNGVIEDASDPIFGYIGTGGGTVGPIAPIEG